MQPTAWPPACNFKHSICTRPFFQNGTPAFDPHEVPSELTSVLSSFFLPACQVSFTLYPDGYDWADPAPATITNGVVASAPPPPTSSGGGLHLPLLPDRFRLVRSGSSLPVEVFIQRSVEWGTWVLGAKVGPVLFCYDC